MNFYPDKPSVPFAACTIPMQQVITYLTGLDLPVEVKRSTYVVFRNESANGEKGFNGNFVGAQADSGRWPSELDPLIVGVVTVAENQTGRERLFLAFGHWSDSVDFLADRVAARGLYVGGTTHLILKMAVNDKHDLAIAYHKEWVTGSAASEPSDAEIESFESMYGQAVGYFT